MGYYDDDVNEISDEISELERELEGKKAERADIATRHKVEIEEARSKGVERTPEGTVPGFQSDYEKAQLPELDRISIDGATKDEIQKARSAEEARAILVREGYYTPQSSVPTAPSERPEDFDPRDAIEAARNASSSEKAAEILRKAGITEVNMHTPSE